MPRFPGNIADLLSASLSAKDPSKVLVLDNPGPGSSESSSEYLPTAPTAIASDLAATTKFLSLLFIWWEDPEVLEQEARHIALPYVAVGIITDLVGFLEKQQVKGGAVRAKALTTWYHSYITSLENADLEKWAFDPSQLATDIIRGFYAVVGESVDLTTDGDTLIPLKLIFRWGETNKASITRDPSTFLQTIMNGL